MEERCRKENNFVSAEYIWKADVWSNSWIHTLMPSSSLTLRIILTHISVILLKAGCSRQMSLRILITRFLTLMPVSCRCTHTHEYKFQQGFFPSKKTKKTWFTTNSRIWRSYILSATGWQQKTKLMTELLVNPFPWQQPQQFQWVHFSLAQDKDQIQCLCAGLWCWYTHRDHNQYDTACCYWDASLITLCTPFTLKVILTIFYCNLLYSHIQKKLGTEG